MLLLVYLQNLVGSCATGSPLKDASDEERKDLDATPIYGVEAGISVQFYLKID